MLVVVAHFVPSFIAFIFTKEDGEFLVKLKVPREEMICAVEGHYVAIREDVSTNLGHLEELSNKENILP